MKYAQATTTTEAMMAEATYAPAKGYASYDTTTKEAAAYSYATTTAAAMAEQAMVRRFLSLSLLAFTLFLSSRSCQAHPSLSSIFSFFLDHRGCCLLL